MIRLLVTGARGFLGRHSLRALSELPGMTTHAVTSGLVDRTGTDVESSARWHRCDLHDARRVRELISDLRPTHLLHLAWVTTPGQYPTSPENETWLASGINLVDEFLRAGGRRMVIAGTCAEYDWSYGRCVESVTPLTDSTPYARSKRQLHAHAEDAARSVGAAFAWGRVFFAYGPGEPSSRLIPSVIRSLREGRTIDCSDGSLRRDFIHAADLGRAFARLVTSPVTGAVNLGTGHAASIATVTATLESLLGTTGLVRLGARKAAVPEAPLIEADMSRLRDEVGFVPRFDIAAGLADYVRSTAALPVNDLLASAA